MSPQLPIHPPAEAPERPHAERSASQLKSLALCPGYKPDNSPKKEVHWVTQQGIRGHDALERDDTGELQSSYEERLVQACDDYCATITPAGWTVLKEQKVDTIEGRWGYFDRLIVSPDGKKAHLVDFKFVKVKKPEDASLALQGKDYVWGLFKARPDLDEIKVHFIAPRFNFVTFHTFTRADLPQIELEIFSILVQARKTDRKRASSKLFRPHYETCRFCGRKATCPALAKIASTVASRYLAEGAQPLPDVPLNVHASEADDPKVLGALKTIATVLDPWVAAVNHHLMTKVLEEGKKVEGYKVGYRKGLRTITNPLALLTIGPKFGVQMSDVLESSKVSVAKLEDVVMAHAPRGEKERTKFAFLDALRDADALTRGEDTAILVRDNDANSPDQ
jgi:hypothetical protein